MRVAVLHFMSNELTATFLDLPHESKPEYLLNNNKERFDSVIHLSIYGRTRFVLSSAGVRTLPGMHEAIPCR